MIFAAACEADTLELEGLSRPDASVGECRQLEPMITTGTIGGGEVLSGSDGVEIAEDAVLFTRADGAATHVVVFSPGRGQERVYEGSSTSLVDANEGGVLFFSERGDLF